MHRLPVWLRRRRRRFAFQRTFGSHDFDRSVRSWRRAARHWRGVVFDGAIEEGKRRARGGAWLGVHPREFLMIGSVKPRMPATLRRSLRFSAVIGVLGLGACTSVLGIEDLHEGPR